MRVSSSDGNVGGPHGAEGIGAAEGEDLVQLLADGLRQDAIPYSVDENDAFAFVLEVLPQNLPEIVYLEVQGGPFRDTVASGDALDVEVNGEVRQRVFAAKGLIGRFLRRTGWNGSTKLAVFIGIDGNEFAADGTDGEAVQFELVEVLPEADDGGRVVGVHHPDLLALEEAFVAGMFILLGTEFDAAFARLVLHGSLLGLRREAFLDDPKVLEVSEFHS